MNATEKKALQWTRNQKNARQFRNIAVGVLDELPDKERITVERLAKTLSLEVPNTGYKISLEILAKLGIWLNDIGEQT